MYRYLCKYAHEKMYIYNGIFVARVVDTYTHIQVYILVRQKILYILRARIYIRI